MKNHLILILTSLLMFSCEQSPSNNPEGITKMSTKYEIESANWCTYSHPDYLSEIWYSGEQSRLETHLGSHGNIYILQSL